MSRVLSQEVYWIPESRQIPFNGSTDRGAVRVWTLYGDDPEVRPELPFTPVHNQNAFLEDFVHDWTVRNGILHYYSRVVQSNVWILVERLEPLPSRTR